jgi:ribosomal protein S19
MPKNDEVRFRDEIWPEMVGLKFSFWSGQPFMVCGIPGTKAAHHTLV